MRSGSPQESPVLSERFPSDVKEFREKAGVKRERLMATRSRVLGDGGLDTQDAALLRSMAVILLAIRMVVTGIKRFARSRI